MRYLPQGGIGSIQRFFVVLSCREFTTANFDGAFEQSRPLAGPAGRGSISKLSVGVGIDNLGGCG
jgi:hypothetical protein